MNPSLKKNIGKFTIKILLLVCFLAILDQFTGRILNKLYFSQVAGTAYRTTYAIGSTKAEILIFGSSRANHHYVPKVFEDSLKISCYNTGRDGNSILYNYAIFRMILKRYNPKIIILDISLFDLYYNKDSYDRLSSLLPYYKDHPEIANIVALRGTFEKIKLLSAIYPYNSSLLSIGIGNFEFNKTRRGDLNGYVPLFDHLKDTILYSEAETNKPIDTTILSTINSMAEICKAKGIRLILVQSPLFIKINDANSIEVLSTILRKYNFEFWNFANDSEFMKNPFYFQDRSHLNNTGAIIYSGIVANKILKSYSYSQIKQ